MNRKNDNEGNQGMASIKDKVTTVSTADGMYNIHYKFEKENQFGPILVLLFGFGMSLESWYEYGYVKKLSEYFKILAVEVRGHGMSSRPHSAEEYSLEKVAGDVIVVLDKLEIQEAFILGYSLGAKVALGVYNAIPSRIKGMMLGGFEIKSTFKMENDLVLTTLSKGPVAWRNLWKSMMHLDSVGEKNLLNADTEALTALRTAENDWPNLESALRKVNCHCLLFVAEKCFAYKDVKFASTLLSDSKFEVIKNHNHFSMMADLSPVIELWINDLKKEGTLK
ncbi:MAG: alpha/beta hydrolase [Oligoflexia bacterium]|nr:alpha/beta hydrolase [Oligoflexia bacterium]